MRLVNTGTVRAPWRLVPKLEEKNICKRFLTVEPVLGMLLPDEVTIALSLKVVATSFHIVLV